MFHFPRSLIKGRLFYFLPYFTIHIKIAIWQNNSRDAKQAMALSKLHHFLFFHIVKLFLICYDYTEYDMIKNFQIQGDRKMLKGIPKIIPPELLKILSEMGHGNEIVIADGNFPSAAYGKRVVYLSGNGGCEVLRAVLEVFPLDTYAQPTYLMAKAEGDTVETPIWDEYADIASVHTDAEVAFLSRQEFYDRAKEAYAVIATGESALYANIILKKGVVV